MPNSQQIIAQFKGTQTLHMSAQEDRSAGGVAYTKTIYSDQAGRSILEEWTLHGAGPRLVRRRCCRHLH